MTPDEPVDDAPVDAEHAESTPTTACDHEPAVGYAVGFVVRDAVDSVDDIGSACDMRATVHEVDVADPNADAVGCAVDDCEGFHERVVEELRRDAARHSGNVADEPPER